MRVTAERSSTQKEAIYVLSGDQRNKVFLELILSSFIIIRVLDLRRNLPLTTDTGRCRILKSNAICPKIYGP